MVEMKAANGALAPAWLDDETISDIILRSADGEKLLSRASLKSFVARKVPLTKPTRHLSRALYKMCAPFGSSGPIVSLLPRSDVLDALAATPPRPCAA